MRRLLLGLAAALLLACSSSETSSNEGTGGSAGKDDDDDGEGGDGGSSGKGGSAGAKYSEECQPLADKILATASKDQALIDAGRDKNPCAEPIARGDEGDYAKACQNLNVCTHEHPVIQAPDNPADECEEQADKIKKTAAKDQALIEQGRDKNPCSEPIAEGDAGDYTQACTKLRACLSNAK